MKSKNILILDDDADNLSMLKELIISVNPTHNVVKFLAPEIAIAFLRTNIVDLIITDYQMPKMMGSDFAFLVKRFKPNIPIAVWSGACVTDPIFDYNFSKDDFNGVKSLVEGL